MMEQSSTVEIQEQGSCTITLSDDELDIHVCGKCKASFTDLSAYIEHKKARNCSKPTEQLSSLQAEGEASRKAVFLPMTSGQTGNKVVVELLDPVDVNSVINDRSLIANNETDQDQDSSGSKPKKRHKRKNSTPKTTRKTGSTANIVESTANVDETNNTVTVHIPDTQLVHLASDTTPPDGSAITTRKQEATSVFVPIYLTTKTKKTFKCSKCPAEFRSKEERGSHGSLHKKHFKCNDCSKKYFTLESLEAHRATESHVHTCEQCGKIFHSQIYLKRHLTVHVVERNFECDICHKAYTSSANCRAHKRSVHAEVKKHVCGECGKAFARKDKLKRHQLIHIPYPNRPIFPCPFRSHTGCTSTFYREDKLKRHLFTHSKEKPYKCGQCEKGFARRDNLNDHIKTHTKDFSYVCTLCQRGFLGPAKLKKHLKSVHTDEDYDIEAMTQRGKTAAVPTMANLTSNDGTMSIQEKVLKEAQASVGLGVISDAISPGPQFQPTLQESDDKEESILQDQGVQPLIAPPLPPESIPPAPPLIQVPETATTAGQPLSPTSGSVFIPRIGGLPNTSAYTRDMLTIPNDLLSIVHGSNLY